MQSLKGTILDGIKVAGKPRVERTLTREDLNDLGADENTLPRNGMMDLQVIRQRHHAVAKLVAQGKSNVEVSLIVGCSPGWVSQLKASPAFKELVSHYEKLDEEAFRLAQANMHERLASLGFDSIQELHDRLESNPKQFKVRDLLAIVDSMSDRTGYGKSATVNHEHTHSLDEETLARIRSAPSQSRLSEEDRGALLRIAQQQTAVDADFAPARNEGSGSDLRAETGSDAQERVSDPAVPSVD